MHICIQHVWLSQGHKWRSDDGLQECMGSEAQTQVVRLGGKCYHRLSHLAGFCADISYMPDTLWEGKEEGHTYCNYLSVPARPRAVLRACHPNPSSQKDAGRHDLISRWQMRSGPDGVQQQPGNLSTLQPRLGSLLPKASSGSEFPWLRGKWQSLRVSKASS